MFSTHKNCLLCNNTILKALKGYDKDYLVKCASCGFVFSERIPSSEELLAHYKKYKRGGAISEITIKRYNELLDVFETYRETNNILDIGCGDGYFLEVAHKRGWKVFGTEFTDEAMEVCKFKGITVHLGTLNSLNYLGIKFDIITSFEVIEHINNPQQEVQHIKEIIRTGGALYITTPNFNSISRTLLGPKWNVIEYPEHLSYYTAKTLRVFLTRHEFKKIRTETTGININRFNQSVDESTTKQNQEAIREKTETKLIYRFLKKTINAVLNITSAGDNLKGLFVKN